MQKDKVIPVITGATGTISKPFKNTRATYRESRDCRTYQKKKKAILGTACILLKILT
jgi:hypothetical protein